MRFSPPLAYLLIALACAACAAPHTRPTEERYAAHVAWLADDARGGREAGSPGYEAASDYAARLFSEAGLVPLGDDGGWFQRLEASGNRKLKLSGNDLDVGGTRLKVGAQWMPFASAPTGASSGELAFVGYGMVDAGDDEQDAWDDYAGIDVSGRVVVVLRGGPLPSGMGPSRGRWLSGKGQRHITTFAKINEAYKHGAAGILIVNDPRSRGDDGDVIIPYASSFRGATASLPAASMTWAAARTVLTPLGLDLAEEQQALDRDLAPRSRLLDGVTVSMSVAAERQTVVTWNVLGLLPGAGDVRDGEHVVLGAHLDHLGLGEHGGSMGGADTVGQIHNGADDNASGTAGVLEIARAMAEDERRPARPVVFALWGAEEWGLLGSRHYVEHPALPLSDCVAMINMDMIGRSVGGHVEVGGVGSAEVLPGLVRDALDEVGGLDAETGRSVSPNSDHQPFLEGGVPVLSLFTGLHEDYHLPSDDVHTIDAAGGADIAALGGSLARRLADLAARPVFVDPNADAPASSHQRGPGRGYSVRFGSLPDMTNTSDDGLRVRGTMADTPAERCGLLKGDVIVAMDGKPIRNLQDYSVLLFSHEPGDVITLTVKRDGETLELTATLDAPRGET